VARPRPRPRGRGDRLAHRRDPRPRPRDHQPGHLRRDHRVRDPGRLRGPAPAQHRTGRCPAGPPRRRSDRGLPPVTGVVAHGLLGHLGRPRAVGRAADDRRPRGRDPRLRARGVLVLPRQLRPRRRRRARDPRQPVRGRGSAAVLAEGPRGQVRGPARQAVGGALRARGHAPRRPGPRARLHGRRGPPHRGPPQPQAAVQDLDAAGRGVQVRLLGPADHGGRAAVVRGHQPRRRAGRADHLHAYRLAQPVGAVAR